MAVELRFDGIHSAEEVADAYRAIGRFVTSVADLDAGVSALLGALTQMHGEGHELIVHSIDFNRKREIIRAVTAFHPTAPLLLEIGKMLDRAEKLMSARHIAAHGLLHTQSGHFIVSSMNLPAISKYARRKAELLRVSTLDKLAAEADTLTIRMAEIVSALRASA